MQNIIFIIFFLYFSFQRRKQSQVERAPLYQSQVPI